LEKDYLSDDVRHVQYYDFGSGRKLFAVTDPVQEFTYIYNKSGKLVNARPLNSSHAIGVMYFERSGKYTVYSAYQNKVRVHSF